MSSYHQTCFGNILLCRASAVFIGVYEPAKQKLLKMFPENLSAAAHFVRDSSIPSYFGMNLWASLWHMTDECLQLSYLLRLVTTQRLTLNKVLVFYACRSLNTFWMNNLL